MPTERKLSNHDRHRHPSKKHREIVTSDPDIKAMFSYTFAAMRLIPILGLYPNQEALKLEAEQKAAAIKSSFGQGFSWTGRSG